MIFISELYSYGVWAVAKENSPIGMIFLSRKVHTKYAFYCYATGEFHYGMTREEAVKAYLATM